MATIREAGPADVAKVAHLRVAMDAEEGVAADSTFVGDFADWCHSHLSAFTVFVAEDGDELIGNLWLEPVERVPRPSHDNGPLGYVTNFFVVPEHRNSGVGGALLDAVVKHATHAGFSVLIASPSERSEPLWRRSGFGATDFLEMPLLPGHP